MTRYERTCSIALLPEVAWHRDTQKLPKQFRPRRRKAFEYTVRYEPGNTAAARRVDTIAKFVRSEEFGPGGAFARRERNSTRITPPGRG